MQDLEREPAVESRARGGRRRGDFRPSPRRPMAAMRDLHDRPERRRRIVDRRRVREPDGHPLRRTTRSPARRGAKFRDEPAHDPVARRHRAQDVLQREPPRGHQNSSASLLMTQSAPCSVAASRAIAFAIRSASRTRRPRGSGEARRRARTTRGSRSCRPATDDRSRSRSPRRRSGGSARCASRMSASSRTRSVMTSFGPRSLGPPSDGGGSWSSRSISAETL